MERQQQIAESLRSKTWNEKLQWGLDTKNLGNSLYQQKKFTEAINAYQDCLLALDLGSTADQQEAAQRQLQIPAVLNLAACMLATKKYHRCKALCNVVLDLEPQSLKAIFRRALANFHLGELEEATQDLQRAYAMCGGRRPCETDEEFSATQQNLKEKLTTKSHSLLSTNSEKEQPTGVFCNAEDREKFLRKVNYYLHAISQQQTRYAKACQNMFSEGCLESSGGSGTQACKTGKLQLERLPNQVSSMFPLTLFKCSKCSFCARRAEKVE
ncbi:tetratricopeptide repeat-containing protein [Toxoplasma gondii ME49]|uniref:70 kDa peptidyl-prolyl isomerase n=9 Tax=Toxoplasma gondii TaxID=5811 RepID=A0A125YRT5_TOXGV|nr:tetratricopeptide repeat-containing protein [Toxoplasma gondii ME49]ESS34488.1 tetratricopeptide repeat-containing protein [Toxoplasma gondii VEG]KFG29144.1 tetratricopeptide repeat-containing protein [Toxoplasma gondii p89]KFG57693.1 tetratricopeptide repeat-containing protein [Toxoplasma gondii RUB]KFG99843.1 tetratricopeptide repeat-containing protein [Toxoplasma gondii VAND]KFH02594.1 tetratricopeptide repeat-containing protein [Toxoplasma gondii MAS]KYF50252.1 tetratricopeptide repeat|eukprot:XP_018635080.1 tetratricopeptide repeat-containing protein [Toxoplasma gondii ME49]